MARQETILCVASYEKGADFMREVARSGCRVMLLTLDALANASWPREILDEIFTMPDGLTYEQIRNTVTWLARGNHFDRIVALDEFDLQNVAALREHMRIPGMGISTTAHFRDKLTMRSEAKRSGFLVPEFTSILNYDDLRAYMSSVPSPWLIKPRAEASAIGIRKVHEPEQVWRTLDELGDRQSDYLMERFVPGTIFHVDSITSERTVVFSEVHRYGKPPMQVMHEGGVFTTRSLDRTSADAHGVEGIEQQAGSSAEHGPRNYACGVYSRRRGWALLLPGSCGAGGRSVYSDLVEHSTGVNLWREWARIEVAHLRGEIYRLPQTLNPMPAACYAWQRLGAGYFRLPGAGDCLPDEEASSCWSDCEIAGTGTCAEFAGGL